MEYEKFYANVKAIAKAQGISMGDIEKEIGHQPGYLSRWSNMAKKAKESGGTESDKFPSIDVLDTISKKLGVSLERLLNDEFSELSDDEITEYQFVLKLLNWTKEKKITWVKGLAPDDGESDQDCLAFKRVYEDFIDDWQIQCCSMEFVIYMMDIYYVMLPGVSEKIIFSTVGYTEQDHTYDYVYPEQKKTTIFCEIGFNNELIYTRHNSTAKIRQALLELHAYLIQEINIRPSVKEKMNKFLQYELPEED